MTDRLLTVDGRSAVRVERRFPHPVEKVWRAVTEPAHLAAWFPSPVELDLRPGGAMRFAGEEATGRVLVVEPPTRFEFRWDTDELRFALREEAGSTVLVLTHLFDDRAGAASFAAGWGACLAALRAVVAGEPLPPPDRLIERHEELVRLFGLDQPQLVESAGGWSARFERQLTCPAAVAWRLFLGGAPAPAVGAGFRPVGAPEVVGTVTESVEERVLAFDVAPAEPGDRVRVELVAGTGHGARLVLALEGVDPAEREAAVEQWGVRAITHVAEEAARWAHSSGAPAVSAM
jgi:uncharacterized protein YndB with AHSA1/START domain